MSEASKSPSVQRSRLPQLLETATVSSLVVVAGWALKELGKPVFGAIAKEIRPESLIHILLLLIILLVFALLWAFSLRSELKNPNTSQFDFNEYGGYYIDPRSKFAVCARCLNSEHPRVVHLMRANNGMMCNSCGKGYRSEETQKTPRTNRSEQ